MATETALVDSALRGWQTNVDRAAKLFGSLSEAQLQQPVAAGKNRLIYLWGHLAAVSDALIPLLGFGERLHPELDETFIKNPDRPGQQTVSAEDMKRIWDQVHQYLWAAFSRLSASEWAQRHTSVSEEDFAREPHRNRFTVLLGRTAHLAYHLGQANLAKK
ncbi:MAG TPA: DinB family protein [Candidatus Angelobacter sp.]|nr:DinB family protein [Candidatus Angelobacter sp.]